MALLVQKFGGSSVTDTERMRAVADHVARTRRRGHDVVVVVSAMGKATDDLIRLANDVSRVQPGREMDMLLTTGERISTALLCMALAELDVGATSFTGSQAGIITDTTHTKAMILEVKGDRLREALAEGRVPVVAAVTHDTSEAKVTVTGVLDRPGIAAVLFRALADRTVNVDMIVQNTSLHGTTDISFTVPKDDLAVSMQVTNELAPQIGASDVTGDSDVGRVSLVGAGMKTHPGV